MNQLFILDGVENEIIVDINQTTWKKDLTATKGYKEVYFFDTVFNSKKFKESTFFFDFYLEDLEGNEIPNSRKNRDFKRDIVSPEWEGLYNLNLTNDQTARAILNGLIATITNKLSGDNEDGARVFDPLTGYLYAEPLDWNVTPTQKTAPETDDGQLQAAILNQFGANTPQFKVTLESDGSLIQDWNNNLLVTGLASGSYLCEIRLTDDFGEGNATANGGTFLVIID